jgi:hypothetical protein
VFCEIGDLSKKYVVAFGERAEIETESLADLVQAHLGMKRDVRIAGRRVPPVQALPVDISRLQEGRKKDHAGVVEQVVHVGEYACWIGRMLDYLKADNAIVPLRRPGAEPGHERVISVDVWEPHGAQRLRQHAVATSIIEHTSRPVDLEHVAQQSGVAPGTRLEIVRIDQVVFIVVNVTLKVVAAKMVERGCEDESAGRTTVVIDGDSRDVECVFAVTFAVFVEIDDAVAVGLHAAAFARRLFWANRLHFRFHRFLCPLATGDYEDLSWLTKERGVRGKLSAVDGGCFLKV